ncbi:MAG: phosphate ABC transporter permease PstA [Gammaproteobacteria bacterium]|nr:phosphate ABC transporter permease PstA [Gammaproteobacteria bacterium]MDH5693351.1 phosphate ABC transporter permease PstA [Gammaproteobacteria bacterium]
MCRTALPKNNRFETLEFFSTMAAFVPVAFFLVLFGQILVDGISGLSWDFLTQNPLDAGRQGGIASIVLSTAYILGICLIITIPFGLMLAIYLTLNENNTNGSLLFLRRSIMVLAGMPSIVVGLFGNAFFSISLGLGFSILSGGLTLACMVLPFFILVSEQALRSVPKHYYINAYALGLNQSSTLFKIALPLAIPGIGAALILSIGRALAETAALIFTAGYVTRTPESVLDSGRALSVHIFDLAMNVPGGNQNAFSTALVLIIFLILLSIATRFLGKSLVNRVGVV